MFAYCKNIFSRFTNQLTSVSDAVTPNNHLGDFYDANTADNDYTYDLNGNLISDKNKGISSITYDYLNFPKVVTSTGKRTISSAYEPRYPAKKKNDVGISVLLLNDLKNADV